MNMKNSLIQLFQEIFRSRNFHFKVMNMGLLQIMTCLSQAKVDKGNIMPKTNNDGMFDDFGVKKSSQGVHNGDYFKRISEYLVRICLSESLSYIARA